MKPIAPKQYSDKQGQDMPEVRNWKWSVPHNGQPAWTT